MMTQREIRDAAIIVLGLVVGASLFLASVAWGQPTNVPGVVDWTIVEASPRVTVRVACALDEGEAMALPVGGWAVARVVAFDSDRCCDGNTCFAFGHCVENVPTTVTFEQQVPVMDGVVRMPKLPCTNGKVVP